MAALKRRGLIYPLLAAAVPVLFLASRNVAELPATDVLAPLAIVLAGTLIATLVLRLFVKDDSKVVVIMSIFLVIFFTYGHIYRLSFSTTILGIRILPHSHLLPIAAIVAVVGVWGVLRHKGNLVRLMDYVGVVASVLIVINVGGILVYVIEGSEPKLNGDVIDRIDRIENAAESPIQGPVQLPDIYHIILDSYGRADVLSRIYGFDNSDFEDFLTQRGFYVAPGSRSNYTNTPESLYSSLNMQYVPGAVDQGRLMADSQVIRFARAVGYKIVHLDSGLNFTARNPNADISLSERGGNILQRTLLTSFSAALTRTTLVSALPREDALFVWGGAKIFNGNMRRLKEISANPEPTFAFSHNLPPHPPYIFGRDGRVRSTAEYVLDGYFAWSLKSFYIDQLTYVNTMIEEVVDEILARASVEPIIIIHGDHGSGTTVGAADYLDERLPILNAYYLPEYCRSGLYPTISPVNSFRLVFDQCFATEFGLLEDKSYHLGEIVP